jgi:antitoxin HicB
MGKRYTVSDAHMVLTLQEAREGGYVVRSPMDPALITEAETVPEAFEMARDAMKTLADGRAKLGKTAARRRARVG